MIITRSRTATKISKEFLNKNNPITVEIVLNPTAERVWKLRTTPASIIQWNNPSEDGKHY